MDVDASVHLQPFNTILAVSLSRNLCRRFVFIVEKFPYYGNRNLLWAELRIVLHKARLKKAVNQLDDLRLMQ